MIISDISRVLSILSTRLGISESELARRIKIPAATFNKLRTGKVIDPKASTLLLIANYFSITVDQLLGNAPLEVSTDTALCYIPLLDSNHILDTSIKMLNYSNHKCWIPFENKSSTHSTQNNLYGLKVCGDAMSPYFDEKTTIIVDRDQSVANKKCVVVYLAEMQEVVLRQAFIDGNSLILKPVNNMFKTITLGHSDQILGVVIHSIRSF